jgi:hypothetical protein
LSGRDTAEGRTLERLGETSRRSTTADGDTVHHVAAHASTSGDMGE